VAKKKTTAKKSASKTKKKSARTPKKAAKKKTAKKKTARKKPATAAKSAKSTKSAKKKTTKTTKKKKATAKKTKARSATPRTKTTRSKKATAPSAKSAAQQNKPAAAAKGTRRKRRPVVAPAIAPAAAPIAPEDLEPALTRREMEEFRILLMQERAQLVGDVDTLQTEARKGAGKGEAGELSSMPIHMADLGTDNYELEFTLGLIEGGRAKLQEIDDALRRIQDGTYGVCLATGKPITKGRLRAKPWAKYCYEYELAQETGQRIR
jgi:RNA polymerase-binding transcription factor DksA